MDDPRPLPFDDDDDAPEPTAPPLSVSELNALVKGLVEPAFGGITVEGEISNCKAWSSGHVYFTLKDDFAQVRAVLFRTQARQLKFRLEDGLRVVIRGRLSVYEVKGEYQLIADTVAPHGLGALQAAFEQLKRQLHAEGLFDAARKRALPALPRRIGIVTSADGAALRDILRILITRHPSASIVIRSARVQGEDAPGELVRALRAIARVPEIDVVIIGRGGGSAEDLWAFNDEGLARAIVACPVPVISAVGHEVDFTIADFVADVRAATPSNAAELVVDRADHVRGRIDRAADRLHRAIDRRVGAGAQRLERCAYRLDNWPVKIALRERDRDVLRSRLVRALGSRLTAERARFDTLRRRLERRDIRRVAADLRGRLLQADGRLLAAVTSRRHRAERLAGTLAARLDAMSPLAVLGRGYALCWNAAHTGIIRSASQVHPGDRVQVTLAEGELGCRVEDTVTAKPRA
jgi:exodeoxyribonuclease VII large subunit